MQPDRLDPVRDMALVATATDGLLSAAEGLDPAAVNEPSRLPGWTRGHVLAHLARNADALVNVLAGAPMYAGEEARDADIERGAPRPLAEQVADVRGTAERLAATAAGLSDADWRERCELRNGVTDVKARIPFRRLVEIELHHLDLDVGRTVAELDDEFVTREIELLVRRFSGHPGVPGILLTAADGRSWTTGGGAPEGWDTSRRSRAWNL